MIYEVETKLNDGKTNAPPFLLEVNNDFKTSEGAYLEEILIGELCNDYDIPFGVGTTLTVKRLT